MHCIASLSKMISEQDSGLQWVPVLLHHLKRQSWAWDLFKKSQCVWWSERKNRWGAVTGGSVCLAETKLCQWRVCNTAKRRNVDGNVMHVMKEREKVEKKGNKRGKREMEGRKMGKERRMNAVEWQLWFYVVEGFRDSSRDWENLLVISVSQDSVHTLTFESKGGVCREIVPLGQ